MKNKFLKIALVMSAIILTTACTEDDATGDATNAPSSPSLTVALDFEGEQSLVEAETTYGFTVSISEAQITNVRVHLSQTGGDATKGDDFDFPSTVTIAAGTTSISDVFTIHADEILEDTETATIQITDGTEANLNSISGTSVTFSIMNHSEDDLAIGLSWAASSAVTNNYGEAIEATDLADMRLLITDVPYTGILTEEDGSGFETLNFLGTYPDGEYYIVADFYSANEIAIDLDLEITLDQVGVINGATHSFPAAVNTTDACADLHYILAKVTKAGQDYTLEKIGEKSAMDLENYVGTWSGEDMWGDTEVTTTLDADGNLEITGVGVVFMTDVWLETILEQEKVLMDVDKTTGSFTIEEQLYMKTEYDGAVQELYYLSGTGTIDPCTNTMDLQYDFVQDGVSYVAWLTQYGYFFHEINVLNEE
ncbi:hypothetical protein N9773_00520 [Flavobacteriaceae bacterium]|nr:hypothetical protein [Flavobacteriaceae bacterium]